MIEWLCRSTLRRSVCFAALVAFSFVLGVFRGSSEVGSDAVVEHIHPRVVENHLLRAPLSRSGDVKRLTNVGPYSSRSFVYSILTTHSFHKTRLRKVMDTWGKHANVVFITTDKADPEFPLTVVLGDGDRDLGGKTLQAIEKFCEYDADFFMFIDDDAFVVASTLERNVSEHFDRDVPLYGGYMLTHTAVPFIGGGGGVLLSNATMKLFCARIKERSHSPCMWKWSKSLPGDVAVSMCMQSLMVDATHIDGFSPFPISRMVDSSPESWCHITWWLPKHLKCNPPFPRAMTVHYVPLDEYDELYYLTYQLNAPS